ncbi:MAG: penicillin-binding transpeptidase domain-containing protein [Patescibacteria group bacterium]|mgnify:CR=1 FL=1
MSFFSKIPISLRRRKHRRITEIAPDEVMIDSRNLPEFDTTQFEGRLEKPISKFTLYSVGGIFSLVAFVFIVQAWNLQIVKGEEYKERSERNMLRPVPVFAGRGIIADRNGRLLAWNAPKIENEDSDIKSIMSQSSSTAPKLANEDTVATREYATSTGLSHVLGYVQYPSKDKNGFYYQNDFMGIAGAEKYFDSHLQGVNGSRLVEVDARGDIVSENIMRPPQQGSSVNLSIDSKVQSALYRNIESIARQVGFAGGAGIIMDVQTGELLALTSYPEYSSQVMSDRSDTAAVKALLNNIDLPFLNRAVDGLYTPGSIVKPFVALAALTEDVIDASTNIVTVGSISIPNPYDSTKSTVFRDWKNHGTVNIRQALAVSSDVYFYTIGGGYKDQKGLGIVRIDKYLKMFGLGELMPDSFAQGKAGTIPTPEWKKKTFNEDWYLGNTYHTSIGQYGFQITPIQMVRAIAAIANNGSLLVPSITKDQGPVVERFIEEISSGDFQVIREGMRLGAVEGTGKALNVPYVTVATKTGTAELGVSKDHVNSWVTGFWPYENPKYAFVVMLEKGSVHNLIGAAAVMRQQLDWMNLNTPEYFKP